MFSRANRGIIIFNREIVETKPVAIASLLGELQFIPTRVEFKFDSDCFEMVGMSPKFDALDAGEKTPEYEVGKGDLFVQRIRNE
jgi:hypothetical protein